MAPHDEFLELCAVSISGELTGEERKRLEEHLRVCASCREALDQFKLSVKASIPAAAEQEVAATEVEPSYSVEKAETAFFSRFDREGGFGWSEQKKGAGGDGRDSGNPGVGVHSGAGWGQLWMPFAAVILLCLALGISAYRLGMKNGVETAGTRRQENSAKASLEEQLSDAGHEREQLRGQIVERDQTIAELRKQVQEQLVTARPEKSAAPGVQNTGGEQGTEATTARVEALQKQLDAEEQARSQQATRANELETKVAELSKQLQESGLTIAQQKRQLDERELTVNQQQELLAHDRDIRELMGARDLYIAEVYDVALTGKTNKPYGRVFYTKGKSLIFYAYDLDQEPGLQSASTFQAWGRRGPNKDHALNLGVFYEDSAANKRWVLKFNDPKTLAQIDAVFVTVEPDGHSNSPRGKQVLFAYLRVNPNHP
jgi:hypothetical protein